MIRELRLSWGFELSSASYSLAAVFGVDAMDQLLCKNLQAFRASGSGFSEAHLDPKK